MATKKKAPPKRGASRYQTPERKSTPGWFWLICGVVIGGFFTFLFTLEPGRDGVKRDRPEQARQDQSPRPNTKTPQTGSSDSNKPRYEFYTILPESEVIVPPQGLETPPPVQQPKPQQTAEQKRKEEEARALAALSGQVPPPRTQPPQQAKPAATAAASDKKTYYLQAGSFRQRADADNVRAQILLLGQNVRVESGTVRDETWYRVMVGPFPDREKLNQAQTTLSSNGFSNLLLQQRSK